MIKPQTAFLALLMASAAWSQQPIVGETVPVQESPARQPPTTTDVNGKSIPAKREKLVFADPDTKMYMPCHDPNEVKSTGDEASRPKPNPKGAVMSEEAAKQHGYKPSAHGVDCPKQGAAAGT